MGGGKHKAHESFTVSPAPASGTTVVDHDAVAHLASQATPGDVEPDPEPEAAATTQSVVVGAAHGGNAAGGPESPATEAPTEAPPELEGAPGPEAVDSPADVAAAAQPAPARWSDTEVLTPVPTEPTPGEVCGTPLLVGGADLEDSLATLVSYKSPGGPREALFATVAPEAEAKLFESLALSEEKLVPVTVEKEVTGRLPADEANQLYEQLATVAKSVNHHLKAGDGVPAHTTEGLAKAKATIEAIGPQLEGEADKAMLAHYQGAVDAIGERLAPGYATAYAAGGKIPLVTPFETTGTVTVTEYVPAPADGVPEGLLGAQLRTATRIGSAVGADGSTSWDGSQRSPAKGKEYAIDLGDGYRAVYRPYAGAGGAATDPDFSQRGSLEVLAPQGAGHGPELVRRLGQLNLVNRPMSAAEGEWSYLTRNIEAQGLAHHAKVAKALAEVDGLEDATTELLVAQRAHEAVGMGQAQLVSFAKSLRLEAEAKALPEKVRLVREGVAAATGFANGAALAASAGYDPHPRASGGWLVWDRFDVAADTAAARKSFGSRGLYHHVTNNNLVEMLRTGGVLASTERRRLMGIKPGKGMSEGSDMGTGGARSVFLRLHGQPSSGPALFWSDPTKLLRRSDWYGYNADHFGSLNPKSGHSTSGLTRDPAALAGFKGGSNEVMFRHGIDLLGSEAPSLIRCSSAAQRAEVLKLLGERGITTLGGKPVKEVVQ